MFLLLYLSSFGPILIILNVHIYTVINNFIQFYTCYSYLCGHPSAGILMSIAKLLCKYIELRVLDDSYYYYNELKELNQRF